MAAGAVRFVGNPHGADVVVDLVLGRNLHELHHAAAPIAQWLDPGGRPQLVTAAVEVVIEVTVALRQAAADVLGVDEAREVHLRRGGDGARAAAAAARAAGAGGGI